MVKVKAIDNVVTTSINYGAASAKQEQLEAKGLVKQTTINTDSIKIII